MLCACVRSSWNRPVSPSPPPLFFSSLRLRRLVSLMKNTLLYDVNIFLISLRELYMNNFYICCYLFVFQYIVFCLFVFLFSLFPFVFFFLSCVHVWYAVIAAGMGFCARAVLGGEYKNYTLIRMRVDLLIGWCACMEKRDRHPLAILTVDACLAL